MPASRILGAVALIALLVGSGLPVAAQPGRGEEATAPRGRTRIVIHPRSLEPGPNARRYCRAWLAVENRPSGQVITPQRECWWQ